MKDTQMNFWLLYAGLIPIPDHWEKGPKSMYYQEKERRSEIPKYVVKKKTGEVFKNTKNKRKYLCEILRVFLSGEKSRDLIYERTKKWRPLTGENKYMCRRTAMEYITYAKRLNGK